MTFASERFERVRARLAVIGRPWGGGRAETVGLNRRGRLQGQGANGFRAISQRVEKCMQVQSMQEAQSRREFERVRARLLHAGCLFHGSGGGGSGGELGLRPPTKKSEVS